MSGFAGKSVFIILCVALFASPCLYAAGPAAVLEDQRQKESYSIGYQVGLSMKSDGVDVDFEKLIQGLNDAIGGNEPLLDVDEMKGLILALKKKARDAQMRKLQEMIVRNAEEAEKFLEENGQKDGVRTTESGLQYMVLNEGSGATPGAGDMVTVHYRGMFTSGEEFDSSSARGEPQTFRSDGVIKGWTEALQMMKAGSKWQIFVPPHLAYGRGGLGQSIPPNKVLVFEIDLLSVKEADETGQASGLP